MVLGGGLAFRTEEKRSAEKLYFLPQSLECFHHIWHSTVQEQICAWQRQGTQTTLQHIFSELKNTGGKNHHMYRHEINYIIQYWETFKYIQGTEKLHTDT